MKHVLPEEGEREARSCIGTAHGYSTRTNVHIHMYVQLLRPGKARQLHLRTTPLFSEEKKSCLRRDLNLRRSVR